MTGKEIEELQQEVEKLRASLFINKEMYVLSNIKLSRPRNAGFWERVKWVFTGVH